MALKAGRVGVNPNYVDKEGRPLYDNSYLKELLRKEGIITLFTKEGNPISIDNAVAGRVYDLAVTIAPKQAGTGTPSRTNVRTISGFSSITVDVNSVDVVISLGDTYYGGYLDVNTGTLTVTHVLVNLGSLTWEKFAWNESYAFTVALDDIYVSSNSTAPDLISDIYPTMSRDALFADKTATAICATTSKTVVVRDYDHVSDTAADFKTSLAGTYICYALVTPTTVSLSGNNISLATGSNTISSDTGTTIDLKYLGTLVPGGVNGRSLNRSLSLNREVITGEEKKEIQEEIKEEVKEVPVEEPLTVKKSTKKSTK